VRVALVTPFAWSQPHDVNEHLAALAAELRQRDHEVTVLAPSNRAADLAQSRRVLLSDKVLLGEVVALGPAVPISRRSRMGVPVGVRASLSLALARGRFDVVHGFEPGLPSLSYLALRDSGALTAATFFSPERLYYPPGKAQRERLLARIDALLATTPEVATAAAARFPGRYEPVPQGIDPKLFAPAAKSERVVVEWREGMRPVLRALVRELEQLPGWELVVLRTRTPSSRPAVSRRLGDRMRVRTARNPAARADVLRSAAIFVPALDGSPRLLAEAQTAGVAIAAPPSRAAQPELAVAETARLIEDPAYRARRTEESLTIAETQTAHALGDHVEATYEKLAARRRSRTAATNGGQADDWTCTRAGRTTARSASTSFSTTQRLRASARSRSPTTTSSAARSRRSRRRAAVSSS